MWTDPARCLSSPPVGPVPVGPGCTDLVNRVSPGAVLAAPHPSPPRGLDQRCASGFGTWSERPDRCPRVAAPAPLSFSPGTLVKHRPPHDAGPEVSRGGLRLSPLGGGDIWRTSPRWRLFSPSGGFVGAALCNSTQRDRGPAAEHSLAWRGAESSHVAGVTCRLRRHGAHLQKPQNTVLSGRL